jgi:TRAP-type mannitol/chloroaromatic compound transport system substrate-binding protein
MKKLIILMIAGAVLALGLATDMAQAGQAPQFKWKLQSTQPAGTPHIELLNKFAANVKRMSAGRLEIEVLTGGAVVDAFHILDGVDKGVVEAGQWWAHYAIGKSPAAGLFTAPLGGAASGLDQMNHVAWYLRGGGRELYLELYQKVLRADVMPFLFAPDGPECLGWFKKPVSSVAEYRKLRQRMSSGLPSDALRAMGGIPVSVAASEIIPSAERGVLDGVEWSNPATDLKLGLYDVFKYYSIQGLHQAIDIADIVINGKKWRELPPDIQAMVEVAMTASLLESMVYFTSENGKALETLVKEKGVKMFDAPPDYAPEFIKAAKKVLSQFEQKDAFFKRVLDSQRSFAKTVVPYAREASKLSTLISGAVDQ